MTDKPSTFREEIRLLMAKAILQAYVAPIPMSYDDIWKQSNEAAKALAIRQADRVLEILDHRNLSIETKPAENQKTDIRQMNLRFYAKDELSGVEKLTGDTGTILAMTQLNAVELRQPAPRPGSLKAPVSYVKVEAYSATTGRRLGAECSPNSILVSTDYGELIPLVEFLEIFNPTKV